MAQKVLALTTDGRLTFCSSPPENRGKGRCNHVDHQGFNEDIQSFMERVSSRMVVEEETIKDQREKIVELVKEFSNPENPDYEDLIKGCKNNFTVGSVEDGTYEKAELLRVDQEPCTIKRDPVIKLTAWYSWRGEEYPVDYGTVPMVNDDKTIIINGVPWRYLPCVERNKAGFWTSKNLITFGQNSTFPCFMMSKHPENPDGNGLELRSFGQPVDSEAVLKYFRERYQDDKDKDIIDDFDGIENKRFLYNLKNIDSATFERCPDLLSQDKEKQLAALKNLMEQPADEINDLEWRRCITYGSLFKEEFEKQNRRMGVTFRANILKAEEMKESGASIEERGAILFQQNNLPDNFRKELVSRSNVQFVSDLNPITALSQSQKVSLTGIGGFNKDDNGDFMRVLRMPHKSHYGLTDPSDVSAGKNIGFTISLTGAKVNQKTGMIEKKPENECLAVSDFIPYKEHNDPNRAQMACSHLKQACPIVGGEDPIVSTKAWDKIKGSKIGVNLNTVYIPSDGNFEDAVIISESAAAKMATIQTKDYRMEKKDDSGNIIPPSVKVGDRVERKQVVDGFTIKSGGVVTEVTGDSFKVETRYDMTVGDKLSNRYGGKSVVSRVVPDDQMPLMLDKDGNSSRAQVQFSISAVAGRKNLGQVMECNQTWNGKSDVDESTTCIVDGHKVQATAGKTFIMRLNHIAEKKMSSYADEMDVKKEYKSPRAGEMERILASTNKDRLKVLRYIDEQNGNDAKTKFRSLTKSIGVDITGVNWDE